CFGDGGAITTNCEKFDRDFRVLRNYGSEKRYYNEVVGYNSRLDELQAGLLRVKLSHLDELTEEREKIAKRYLSEIKNPKIELPLVREGATSVWHLFVVKTDERDRFQKYLEENGVGTVIHYPIPPHLSKAYEYLGYKKGDFPITEKYAETVLSLPLYNGMTEEEQSYVIEVINRYE
ncbi:MAG: DegT/DnrJ/EryC1/StrS family aminotransferase, partial [Cetobacterium sp.]